MHLRSELHSEDDILNSEISVNTNPRNSGRVTDAVSLAQSVTISPSGVDIKIADTHCEVRKNSNKRNIEFFRNSYF